MANRVLTKKAKPESIIELSLKLLMNQLADLEKKQKDDLLTGNEITSINEILRSMLAYQKHEGTKDKLMSNDGISAMSDEELEKLAEEDDNA
jgi:hypothetical protein